MLNDEALWRGYSRVYDEVLKVIPYRNLLLDVVEHAQAKDGLRVLDACCGTFNLLWALQEQRLRCHVTGLDYSDAMLEKATRKLPKYDGQAELVKANLDEPVGSWGVTGPFDRIIFNNSLCLLNDPAQALQKAAALAADNARLVMSTPRPNPNIQELLDEHLQLSEGNGLTREEAMQQLMPRLQPLLKYNEMLFARYGDNYHLPSESQLRHWFKNSGWRILDIDLAYAGQNWLVTAVQEPQA